MANCVCKRFHLLCVIPALVAAHEVLAQDAGGGVPSDAPNPSVTLRMENSDAVFTVAGDEPPIVYRWSTGAATATNAFGDISAIVDGNRRVNYTTGRGPDWTEPATPVGREFSRDGDSARLTLSYKLASGPVVLQLRAHVEHRSLALDITADQPRLKAVELGTWKSGQGTIIPVPYNPFDTVYLPAERLFASAYFDWLKSDASTLDGRVIRYDALTNGTRNTVSERLILTVSGTFANVLPNSGATRSRYFDRVAGRLVLDITSGQPAFAPIEARLRTLQRAGLGNCIVILHNWQREGYDNALPSVLPPRASSGGADGLLRISNVVREAGCEFALHENYIDYYPNSDGFDPDDVALRSDGQREKAWFNTANNVQSYAARPRSFTKLAKSIAPLIRDQMRSTASYLDVNSSVVPWRRADMDAREPLAGKFRSFVEGTRELLAFLQETYRGPVLGEGHNHFFWTGAVDGVPAELTIGYKGEVPVAPLLVDFDLQKMHPFQVNAGMGYYFRYNFAPVVHEELPMETDEHTRDIYRTQEIAFGHAAYRSGSGWYDVRLYTQEAALAQPVTAAYAAQQAKDITYRVDGRWAPVEDAIARSQLSTVRVAYADGLVVTANTGADDVGDEHGRILPAGGWSAVGAGIEAYSAMRNGQRIDFAQTKDSVYADPRGLPGNWTMEGDGTAERVDFGPLTTTGQTWIRCENQAWTFRTYAKRGFVDIDVSETALARPIRLVDTLTEVTLPIGEAREGRWSAHLVSGRAYRTEMADASACRT